MNLNLEIPKVEAREKAHQIYWLDGKVVPGVTTVLNILNKPALIRWANEQGLQGIDVKKHVDRHALVGTLCHAFIENDIKKMWGRKVDELDPDYYPKVDWERALIGFERWLRWKETVEFEPIDSELQLVSRNFGYGGTIDIYCLLNNRPTLLDIKTSGGIYEEMGYQVAAYENLLKENGREVDMVAILRVGKLEKDEGEFRYYDKSRRETGFEIFKHCLEIHRIKGGLKWN